MPIVYGQVGAPSTTSAADSSNLPALQGKQSELIATELHGKYYTQAYRNNLFIGSTAIGGVVTPAYNTTAQVFGLWNPAGNTKNAVLVHLDAGLVTLGTPVISTFTLSQSLNAGSALATGGISAFTSGTPQGGNIGISGGNTVRFTPSAATTLAATFLAAIPWSFYSTTTSGSAGNNTVLHYDFDGTIIVPPNAALWVTNNAANGSTWALTMKWEEVPV